MTKLPKTKLPKYVMSLTEAELTSLEAVTVYVTTVMPLVVGRNFGVQLTKLQPGGQIMPNTLLLAHPDLKISGISEQC